MKDTIVTAENIAAPGKGGARLTIRPIKPVDVDWLRKETATRLTGAKAAPAAAPAKK